MAERPAAVWLDSEAGQRLAADLTARARKQYRITQDEALEIVLDVLRHEHALGTAIASGRSVEQIERTRQFKDLVSATRKKMYYHLRRYDRASPDAADALGRLDALAPGQAPDQALLTALAGGHVSTAERLPGLAAFHETLFAHIGAPASVLDVGSGIYPVLFPFDAEGSPVRVYVAADKDPQSIHVLESYARARADGRLVPVRFDINQGWPDLCERTGRAYFDVAFLFKVVPVVQRRDRAAYAALMRIPADLIVLTGAATSMTKHRSIQRRERAILLSFAAAAGLTVRADIISGDECFIVAVREPPSVREPPAGR